MPELVAGGVALQKIRRKITTRTVIFFVFQFLRRCIYDVWYGRRRSLGTASTKNYKGLIRCREWRKYFDMKMKLLFFVFAKIRQNIYAFTIILKK